MPTKNDVIKRAFRMLGVVAEDEHITADQEAFATDMLESLYAEVAEDAWVSFTLDDIPDISATHLAGVLAADLAAPYSSQAPRSRGAAMLRLVATIRPDNREDQDAEAEYF